MARGPERPDWGQYDDETFDSEERTEDLFEGLDERVAPIVAQLTDLSFENQMFVIRCGLSDLHPEPDVEMHIQFAERYLTMAARHLRAAQTHDESGFDAEFDERLDDIAGLSAKFAEELEAELGAESMEEFVARKNAEMEELLDDTHRSSDT